MILADTSGLLAAFHLTDANHRAALGFLQAARRPGEIVVPAAVVVELGPMLERRVGTLAEATALRRFGSSSWRIEHFTPEDLLRAADLVEQYADFPLGTVDALIVAMAERLDITTIFTLDRRHFGAVRPAHCEAFEIVPGP
ncbi:MAG: PIN domain-containing protein [Dehalococcoidia bacterium]